MAYQAIFVGGIGRNLNPGAWTPGRTAFPMIYSEKSSMGGMSLEGITYQNDNSGYLMCQGKTTLPFLNEIQ